MSGKQACKYYIYSDIGREEKILKEQRKTQLILFCEESPEMRVRRWGVMCMTNKSTIFYMPIYDCRELAKKKKKKRKLNGLKRQKLERQNSWQQVKHAKLCSDLLQACERDLAECPSFLCWCDTPL